MSEVIEEVKNTEEIPVEIKEQIDSIPTEGQEAQDATVMNQNMREEMQRQQQEFMAKVLALSVDGILSGEIPCSIEEKELPPDAYALIVNDDTASWNISILIEILDKMQKDDIFTNRMVCTILEGYMDLFNHKFLTWRYWRDNAKVLINNYFTKAIKKNKPEKYNWDNIINWLIYSLINTNAIRETVVEKYIKPEIEKQQAAVQE